MKILKKNTKVIIGTIVGILIGVLITGGIVYAVTSANQVTYTTDKNTQINNVSDALNDLYSKINNTDNYNDKTYINTGLTVFNNRVTITNGGYYIDESGTTWVNITFRFNQVFNEGTWIQIYGLPNLNNKDFIISDTSEKMPFRVYYGEAPMQGRITYIGQETAMYNNPTNTDITLKFKY